MKKFILKTIGVIIYTILIFQNYCYADMGRGGGTLQFIEEARRKAEINNRINFIKEILPIVIIIGLAVVAIVVSSFFILRKINKDVGENEER